MYIPRLRSQHVKKIITACRYASPRANEIFIRPVERIRNVGISAHVDSGKTTVTERILFYAGKIDEIHEVKGKDGVGATMDFMELERQRGITIQSAATYVNWHGTNLNIIDTPGHIDFTIEVERALRVLDGAILVVCGSSGVQSQTFTVDRQLNRYKVPFITFINKLDRVNANPQKGLDGLRTRLNHNAAFVQLPIGLQSDFKGLIDIIEERAIYNEGERGLDIRYDEVPMNMREEVKDRRQELIEHLANGDSIIGEKYLNEENPTNEEIHDAIRRSVKNRTFLPVFMGSALKDKGIQPLIDAVVRYLPNPSEVENRASIFKGQHETKVVLNPARTIEGKDPLVALAFKIELRPKIGQLTYFRIYQGHLKKGVSLFSTREGRRIVVKKLVRMHANQMVDIENAFAGDIVASTDVDCHTGETFTNSPTLNIHCEAMHVPDPVISMRIAPVNPKRDGENFMKALNHFTRCDPSFTKEYNVEYRETIVHGMGELHLEIYSQRMKSEFDCEVELGQPTVAYRETIDSTYIFNYRHKMQTGGQGQFGEIYGIIEPLDPSKNRKAEMSFEGTTRDIPNNLVPYLEEGLKRVAKEGPLTKNPITNIMVRIKGGSSHEVDSTQIAMINTMIKMMEEAFVRSKWAILEPMMNVEITAPSIYRNELLASFTQRRGVVEDIDHGEEDIVITGEAPLSDMFGYTPELRSLTSGKGSYVMEFANYRKASPDKQRMIVRDWAVKSGAIDLKKEAKELKKAEEKARRAARYK